MFETCPLSCRLRSVWKCKRYFWQKFMKKCYSSWRAESPMSGFLVSQPIYLPSAAMSLILHFAISFNSCVRSCKHLEPNIATKFGRSPCVCSRTEGLGWSHPLHPRLIPPPPNSLERPLRRLMGQTKAKIKSFVFTNRRKRKNKILKVPHTSRWQTVPLVCQTIMTNQYCWTKFVNHWKTFTVLTVLKITWRPYLSLLHLLRVDESCGKDETEKSQIAADDDEEEEEAVPSTPSTDPGRIDPKWAPSPKIEISLIGTTNHPTLHAKVLRKLQLRKPRRHSQLIHNFFSRYLPLTALPSRWPLRWASLPPSRPTLPGHRLRRNIMWCLCSRLCGDGAGAN